ncbi:MAG: hypothetical protein E6J75_10080 [Deltaproteobacteria bacterium]|nr:MAG: hypothetical protein E6J75_10080 [Deltaproteobacteria bacterium]
MRRAHAVLVGLIVCGPGATGVHALNFFELEVYPATTEGKGLHEVENTTSFVANGRRPTDEDAAGEEPRRHRLLRTTLEYDYGLTDKIDVAAYLDLQRPNGEDVEYAQSRFRARGALFDKGRFFLDLGWYLEAEVPDQGESQLELEFRPIVSRDIGRFSVDLNPMFELPTVASERRTLEFNYGARVYYRLSRRLAPGVEFFGDAGQIRRFDPAREQQHYVFPALYGQLARGLKCVAGLGFGLTRASDPVILKFGLEYEFTLPAGGGGGPPGPTY